jgi:chitinase
MGVPFYGRGWDGCPSTNNGLFQTCAGMSKDGTFVSLDPNAAGAFFHWHLADAYVNKNGFKRYWDDVAKVPYLYRASDGRWISYDDKQSILLKAQYVKNMGLKGAMAWTVSTDKGKGLDEVRSGPLVNVLGDTLLPASLTKKGDKPAVKPKAKKCKKGFKKNKKGKCVKVAKKK